MKQYHPNLLQGQTGSASVDTNSDNWPSWTYSRGFPDYVTVEGTALIFSIGFLMDTYSNIYLTTGLSVGPELVVGGLSGRAAGGWIAANQQPQKGKLGLEWTLQRGRPREDRLESYLEGWSVNAGAGGGPPQTFFLGPGAHGVFTLSNFPSVGVESGIYTAQAGPGLSYGMLLYDNGSHTPWFWQRWWGWGLPPAKRNMK